LAGAFGLPGRTFRLPGRTSRPTWANERTVGSL